ncbi:MAG: DUF2268 domain-containing putative Zn-dependent protease [Kangiellaceae bacterium]
MLVFTVFILVSLIDYSKGYLNANEMMSSQTTATFEFENDSQKILSSENKTKIKQAVFNSIATMNKIMPGLASSIHFKVGVVDHDLSMVSGVTGRADKPTEIELTISTAYEGGIEQAIVDGLQTTSLHELHHTIRGWTIYGNKFGQGINIAIVNEGLADVFAEYYSGKSSDHYPTDVDLDQWVKEIIALPKDANYGQWMFKHADGREAIGYRAGSYLIKQAMKNSGKNILQLSELPVKTIYKLAGY